MFNLNTNSIHNFLGHFAPIKFFSVFILQVFKFSNFVNIFIDYIQIAL